MPHLYRSALRDWFDAQCATRGVAIEWNVITPETLRDYKALFRSFHNVITWGFKMPHSWYTEAGQNVLFIENSLICQRAGVFVDHRGFFSESNLCVGRTWQADHQVDVEEKARCLMGWEFASWKPNPGPILVALQMRRDATMLYHFPTAKGRTDRVVATLETAAKHLPRGHKIFIRPHPRERDLFAANMAEATGGVWRDDWELDMEGGIEQRLPQCRALVTVNSTCASEASLLGIPTATMGHGAFTGSGTTLECAGEPGRLASLLSFAPDTEKCRAYAQALLGRHFLPYNAKEAQSQEFESWLAKC